MKDRLFLKICDANWSGSDAGVQVHLDDSYQDGIVCTSPLTNSDHCLLRIGKTWSTEFECSGSFVPSPECTGKPKKCNLNHIQLMQDGAGIADGFCYSTIFITDVARGGIVFAQQSVNVWINEANKLYKLYPQWFYSGPGVTGGDVTRPGTPNKERRPEEEVDRSLQQWIGGCSQGPGTGTGMYQIYPSRKAKKKPMGEKNKKKKIKRKNKTANRSFLTLFYIFSNVLRCRRSPDEFTSKKFIIG